MEEDWNWRRSRLTFSGSGRVIPPGFVLVGVGMEGLQVREHHGVIAARHGIMNLHQAAPLLARNRPGSSAEPILEDLEFRRRRLLRTVPRARGPWAGSERSRGFFRRECPHHCTRSRSGQNPHRTNGCRRRRPRCGRSGGAARQFTKGSRLKSISPESCHSAWNGRNPAS